MVRFNFNFKPNVTLEQRIGFEMAAAIWQKVLKDDITVTLEIRGVAQLENDQAIGGAVPITVNQHYGVFKQYQEQDATSEADRQAAENMQAGNTTDFLVDDEVVTRNSEILLTSAQARALGMEEAIAIKNGTTEGGIWENDLIEKNALDGYILINNSFDWGYNYTREDTTAVGKLDFLSMALHEIGHSLGFVSGMDGTIDVQELLSGETRIKDFTMLDLFRHTEAASKIESIDGNLSSLTVGDNAYLSVDNGATNLGDFATGTDTSQGGDGHQASHWKRGEDPIGIMDPTLAYDEFVGLSVQDIRAMDILGWDVDLAGLSATTNMQALLKEAEEAIAASTGIDSQILNQSRGDNYLYTMDYTQWLQMFEDSIFDMGHSQWYQVFEIGYSFWSQQTDGSDLSMGGTHWYQMFEESMFDMGMGHWYQMFEESMFNIGMGDTQWYQILEVGYENFWQSLDTYFSTFEKTSLEANNVTVTDNGEAEEIDITTPISGGDADDILVGSHFKDLVNGGKGDDLIAGKAGDDTLLGEGGDDTLLGEDGDDKIYGGHGDDFIEGGNGSDRLYGQKGHDILSGGFGSDIISGGQANDLLKGDGDSDVLDGGDGNDNVSGDDGNDIVIGGQGRDVISGGRGRDILYGDLYTGDNHTEQNISIEEISQQAGFTAARKTIDIWTYELEKDFVLEEGFSTHSRDASSGGGFVSTGSKGVATTGFDGPSGVYDLVVGYHDESDGIGEITVELEQAGAVRSFSWKLDKNLQNAGVGADNFVTYTIRDVQIDDRETIRVIGQSEGYEFMRMDHLNIISTTKNTALASAEFYDGSFYLESESGDASKAIALGGELISADSGSAEAHWLRNTLGTAQNVIKVDARSHQFNIVQNSAARNEKKALRFEAESFDLEGGYEVEERNDFSSGKAVIATSKGDYGKATSIFQEASGTYDISVSYLDENYGAAWASFKINGKTIKDWQLITDASRVAGRQSVGTQIQINEGDSISIEGWADSDDLARIDYVEFLAVEEAVASTNEDNSETAIPVGQTTIVEAESIYFSGTGEITSGSTSGSGGQYATIDEASGTLLFTEETGYYDVIIRHGSFTSERTELAVQLGTQDLDRWQVEESNASTNGWTERTVAAGVELNNNSDYLKIIGTTAGNARAYVDYIKFVRVAPPVEAEAISDDASVHSDFLRGGEGSDVIYGGEGDDTLYGESEFDSGLDDSDSNDTLYGGRGNDNLYGNAGDDILYGNTEEQAREAQTPEPSKVATTLTFEQGTNGYNSTFDTKLEGYYRYRSHGNDIEIGADGSSSGYSDYGLIRFDDIFGNNAGQIGSGVDITAAIVELTVTDEGDRLAVHEMLRDWSENDTWHSWGEGIQANGIEAAEGAVDVTGYVNEGILRLDVTESLRAWQANPSANKGWALISQGSNGVDFMSSESSYEPRLIVEAKQTNHASHGSAPSFEDNDYMVGGRGNDRLEGGIGDDRLEGSDEIALGAFEKDILVGGTGSDTFVLGSAAQSYYTSDFGSDYARIKDFDAAVDVLQLHGSADRYVQWSHNGDLRLHDGQDLIAVIENVTEVNLNSTSVTFV